MRILFLGDLHGNMVAARALENVIHEISPDDIWFLGDAVGKGPQSDETCDWVREHCRHFIGGNWDYGIADKAFPADEYFWNQLGPERMQWLSALPSEAELMLSGIRFRLFHGRPVTDLLQSDSDKALLEAVFHTERGDFGGAIFADSHRPFFRTLSGGYLINTGSVGNSMGIPNAHAVLLECTPGEEKKPLFCTVICVPYDNEAAADIARRDPGLPRKEAYIREVLTGIYSR